MSKEINTYIREKAEKDVGSLACARMAVWSVISIFNLNDDYIYCATDSIKFKNPEKHIELED